MKSIDPDLLQTLVAFADTGSLSLAAAVVGRSRSAVTAQMQRLDEIVGEPLLEKDGRGRTLTVTGQEFLVHARLILDANRSAWLALKGARADGQVTIGATQDFASRLLPGLLRAFSRTHPRVRIGLRVGRSHELSEALQSGAADVVVTMRLGSHADEVGILREPMLWLGSVNHPSSSAEGDLPLALLDPPCGFRSAAIFALESARRPYRIAATSASLSGLGAAVCAGIAITARTTRWASDEMTDVGPVLKLPALPDAVFSIRLREGAGEAATDMALLLRNALEATRPDLAAEVSRGRMADR